jgi:hypothetical protein
MDPSLILADNRFRTLATHFLDSFNPGLDRHVVVLDAIWSLPLSYIPSGKEGRAGRDFAHAFVHACVTIIEHANLTLHYPGFDPEVENWVKCWAKATIPYIYEDS